MIHSPSACPLCQCSQIELYFTDARRYWQCSHCHLVFVDFPNHLTESSEKSRYDLHENDSNDAGYRAFLNRLLNPLSERLANSSQGLDFGCGPGPTISVLLAEKGHQVACFDKYYANDTSLLSQKYDFITSTEVVEHLREPGQELERLIKLLRPAGYLGIMTKLLPAVEKFEHWHYKNDQTHIAFYSESTFEWIASQWDLSLEILDSDVIILQAEG